MKRVLIFSSAYYPKHVGEAEVALKEITDRIPPDQISFELITLRFDGMLPRTEQVGNVKVYRLGTSVKNPSLDAQRKFPLVMNTYFFPILAVLTARKLFMNEKYDALWVTDTDLAGLSATLFRRFVAPIPYLLSFQEDLLGKDEGGRKRVPTGIFRTLLHQAKIIQPVNNSIAKWVRELGYKGIIEVVPNAVEMHQFGRVFTEREVAERRVQLHKGERDQFVLVASTMKEEDGIELVVRSLALLPERVKLIIEGEGERSAQVRTLVLNLDLGHRVVFLGHIASDALPEYLSVSEVFVRLANDVDRHNTFEAMRASVPVVALSLLPDEDLLRDPVVHPGEPSTGLFSLSQNPKELAEKLLAFLDAPEYGKQCSHHAQLRIVAQYNWNVVALRMVRTVFTPLFSQTEVVESVREIPIEIHPEVHID